MAKETLGTRVTVLETLRGTDETLHTLEHTAIRTQITTSEDRIMERLSQNGFGEKQKRGVKKTGGIALLAGSPIAAIGYLVVQDLLARV